MNNNRTEILNVEQIFKSKYVIPLYQRNFTWGKEQISQLLRDFYESMKAEECLYFVGSLVVIPRRTSEFEVIDGQQRLTIMSLLSYVLQFPVTNDIHYDSRHEVEDFFKKLASNPDISRNEASISHDASISHYYNAYEILKEEINELEELELKEFENQGFRNKFSSFFKENVFFIREIMPQDTDVASYFEIMNNRGKQLQEHEVVKGLLLDKLKEKKEFSHLCSLIWDACSQMDVRIQKTIPSSVRKTLFGKELEDFITYEAFESEELLKSINNDKDFTPFSLNFENLENLKSANNKSINDEDKPENNKQEESVIDFPNFLMQVMRLYYDESIPLYDKHLLKVFRSIKDKINPIEFIYRIVRCRTIFDRYIVKYVYDIDKEEREWTLRKPRDYESHLDFVNSFEDSKQQDMIIKALSCIQVCHQQKYYKSYLQSILKWFKDKESIIIESAEEYLSFLNKLIFDELNEKSDFFGLVNYNEQLMGTKISHIIFNYIDYMLWCIHVNKTEPFGEEEEWGLIKDIKDFRFQYWNSIEHHYPQNIKEELGKVSDFELNCLGNLLLISKSANSRLSDKDPVNKARLYEGKKVNLAPNRQLIYSISRIKEKWGKDEIHHHLDFIEKLFKNAKTILCDKKEV